MTTPFGDMPAEDLQITFALLEAIGNNDMLTFEMTLAGMTDEARQRVVSSFKSVHTFLGEYFKKTAQA